jgi:hypothetical protein
MKTIKVNYPNLNKMTTSELNMNLWLVEQRINKQNKVDKTLYVERIKYLMRLKMK